MNKQELFDHIKKVICEGERIPEEVVFSRTRKREIVFARQLIMYFAYMSNVGTQVTIGKMCGDKDHATVLHSFKSILNYVDTDPMKRDAVEIYDKIIKGLPRPGHKADNELLKSEIASLKAQIKLLEDEVFRLQCRGMNQYKAERGESIRAYSGYREHQS